MTAMRGMVTHSRGVGILEHIPCPQRLTRAPAVSVHLSFDEQASKPGGTGFIQSILRDTPDYRDSPDHRGGMKYTDYLNGKK